MNPKKRAKRAQLKRRGNALIKADLKPAKSFEEKRANADKVTRSMKSYSLRAKARKLVEE